MERQMQGGIGSERRGYEGQEPWRFPAGSPWVSVTCEHALSLYSSPRTGRSMGVELQGLFKKVRTLSVPGTWGATGFRADMAKFKNHTMHNQSPKWLRKLHQKTPTTKI